LVAILEGWRQDTAVVGDETCASGAPIGTNGSLATPAVEGGEQRVEQVTRARRSVLLSAHGCRREKTEFGWGVDLGHADAIVMAVVTGFLCISGRMRIALGG
jgi:hypothetical protein